MSAQNVIMVKFRSQGFSCMTLVYALFSFLLEFEYFEQFIENNISMQQDTDRDGQLEETHEHQYLICALYYPVE